ncbi:MAG: hypothetical protein JO227_23570 [Acetobacteraceae bacterium]|nr:hypothetical protein [Acetobacteraceae bacterium]
MKIDHLAPGPRTHAARQALSKATDNATAADVLFLEYWEMQRTGDLAATLRARQIRRANPGLAAAIHDELTPA